MKNKILHFAFSLSHVPHQIWPLFPALYSILCIFKSMQLQYVKYIRSHYHAFYSVFCFCFNLHLKIFLVRNKVYEYSVSLFMEFPGKNTCVGCHFLLQGIFLVQGLHLCLLYCLRWQVGRWILPTELPEKPNRCSFSLMMTAEYFSVYDCKAFTHIDIG